MRLEQLHKTSEDKVVVFYDGVCNLCNGFVRFVMKRDPEKKILFCPLQDETAQEVRKELSLEHDITTVIALSKGTYYLYSDVTFLIAKTFGGPWHMLIPLQLIPKFIRDSIYHWVAKNRYKWFGRKEMCEMMMDEDKAHFAS